MGKVCEALASLVELVLMALVFPLVILLLGLPVALLVRDTIALADISGQICVAERAPSGSQKYNIRPDV